MPLSSIKIEQGMQLVMKLASIGHAARNKANRKVRQPLDEAAFSVANYEEEKVVVKYAEILKDELNVKSIRVMSKAGEAASFSLNPLPKQLGQKYGSNFPAIRKAIMALDAEKIAPGLLDGQTLKIETESGTFEILPEEVEVRVQAKAGFAVASEGAISQLW